MLIVTSHSVCAFCKSLSSPLCAFTFKCKISRRSQVLSVHSIFLKRGLCAVLPTQLLLFLLVHLCIYLNSIFQVACQHQSLSSSPQNNNVTEYRFYPPQTHHSLATVTYRRIRPYFRHQIRLRCKAVRPRVLKWNKNEACQVRHRSPQNDVQVDGLQINLLRGRIHMDYSI